MIIINYTSTYSFQKPISDEKYNIEVFNTNMDLIDSVLNRIEKKNESQDNLLATKTEVFNQIEEEAIRATNSESLLHNQIVSENTRAINEENRIENTLRDEIERSTQSEQNIIETISTNKPIWDDKYTRNEIDIKFSALETNNENSGANGITYSDAEPISLIEDMTWIGN